MLRNFLKEGDLNKGRRYNFVTSGAGASDGTTVVASSATGIDDSVIGAYLTPFSEAAQGEERGIIDFVDSSGTFTVSPAFSVQIDTGSQAITMAMFERGKYSDLELENALLQAENKIAMLLPTNALFYLQETVECSLTNGVIRRDIVLSNMVQLTMMTDIDRNVVFRILPATALQVLKTTNHADFATTGRPAVIQAGTPANDRYGDLWVLPSDIATVEAHIIKSPTDFTVAGATETSISDTPDRYEALIILYAAYLTTGDQRFMEQFMQAAQTIRPSIDTETQGYALQSEPRQGNQQ